MVFFDFVGFLAVFLKALKNTESGFCQIFLGIFFRVCCTSLNLALMSDASSGVSQ